MRSKTAFAIVLVLLFAGRGVANEQLVAQLKALGKAVDDMSANMSKATTDADAKILADATREALDKGFSQERPRISIETKAGFCRVIIEAPAWKLWSEAHKGKVIDHGAKVH